MPRKRDEALIGQARVLASEGMTVTGIAAILGVNRRTVQRWGITAPAGRPRLPEGQGSARTRRRRASGNP